MLFGQVSDGYSGENQGGKSEHSESRKGWEK